MEADRDLWHFASSHWWHAWRAFTHCARRDVRAAATGRQPTRMALARIGFTRFAALLLLLGGALAAPTPGAVDQAPEVPVVLQQAGGAADGAGTTEGAAADAAFPNFPGIDLPPLGGNETDLLQYIPGTSSSVPESDFDIKNCGKMREILSRYKNGNVLVLKAFLVLSYFVACASLLFMLVALVRIHMLGARSPMVKRAAGVFVVLLVLAASVMLGIRGLLHPYDLSVLPLKRVDFADAELKCKREFNEWPKTVSSMRYIGQPPVNHLAFWVLVAAAYLGAVALSVSLVHIMREDRQGTTAWKRSSRVFNCDCDPSECVHT